MPKSNGFKSFDYIKITIFGFGLSALWASLHSLILPLRLLDFVAEQEKTLWLGLLTLAGLLVAMLAQPVAGAISDRSRLGWGRRRPYILLGTILSILILPGIGLAGSFAVILLTYCLLQVSGNVAQAPYQALIPDFVPEGKRGVASGVKSLLEILGGVVLVRLIGYFMDRYFSGQGEFELWLALGVLATLLFGVALFTVFTIKEKPRTDGAGVSLLTAISKSFKIDVKANSAFVFFLVSRFLILTALITLQRYALYFMMDVVGVANPARVTADLLIAVGVGMLVSVYPAGRLSDRIGRRPIVVSSGLLGAFGIVVLYFSKDFSDSYTLVLFAGAILGISGGAFMSTNWALATDLVAPAQAARYLGLTNLATAGSGAMVGLMGLVIYLFNVTIPGLGYSVMLLLCFVYFIAGSLLVLKIKPQGQPK